MHIVVTGATGNLGTSLVERLSRDHWVERIVGVARRLPQHRFARTRFVAADVAEDDLTDLFRGADAVVHLAWRLQPSHDEDDLRRTNVDGSRRVFDAVERAGVPALLVASSAGTYAAGPKDRLVGEDWPSYGIDSSLSSRQKAEVERLLDRLERRRPALRVVRFRPAPAFKREAASEVRRLFLGPLLPRLLFDRRLLRLLPDPRLRVQCVHSFDVAEAFRAALRQPVRGPFNLATDPVLDARLLARRLHARCVRVPRGLLRGAAHLGWRTHLLPSDASWLDLGLEGPLLDAGRARRELDWRPVHDSVETVLELLAGLRDGAGLDTPPLEPRRGKKVSRPAGPVRDGRRGPGEGTGERRHADDAERERAAAGRE